MALKYSSWHGYIYLQWPALSQHRIREERLWGQEFYVARSCHPSLLQCFFFFWAFYKSMINLISIVWDAIPSASFSLCLEVLCAHFIHQIGFFCLLSLSRASTALQEGADLILLLTSLGELSASCPSLILGSYGGCQNSVVPIPGWIVTAGAERIIFKLVNWAT